MKILGKGGSTYLYLNGITLPRSVRLVSHLELLPASCSPAPDLMIASADTEAAIGVMALFLRHITSQFHVAHEDPRTHAVLTWNSLWDALILSALFDCEVGCNFQSDSPAEELARASNLRVTNYHLRGMGEPRKLTEAECVWLETRFASARELAEQPPIQNAVHCMASYRWHPHARSRLALIWSGIEGLFGVDSEVTFRLSLYISRFLEPSKQEKRRTLFKRVKKLYGHRSKAVHGSVMKGGSDERVVESARLLKRLLYTCFEKGASPNIDELAP